ncbi:hypothetical protein AAGR22_13980 [Erwinia sp. HDF1-3R]|uniref:hypothetical protein n=1 Tax=Erwinia sp. HDF1-3R TaxID=3141543 RepID=UPI0031F5CFF4
MSKKISLPSLAVLRWKSAWLVEKYGKWPLAALALPVALAIYWTAWLNPENARLRSNLAIMQSKLKEPLPIIAGDEPSQQTALSITEYEQVKMLFAIFSKYHLQAEGSRYHFSPADQNYGKTLKLSVPLQGSWPQVAQALQEIMRVLPVTVDSVNAKRKQVDSAQLALTLQLTLRRGQT